MLLHLCYTSMQMGRVFQHFRPVNIIRIYIYIFFFSFEGFEGNGTLRVINFSRAIFARKSRYLASIFSRIEMSRSRIIELVVDKETKGGEEYTRIYSNFTVARAISREHVSIPFSQGLSDTEENSMYQGTQKESPRLANK